MKPQHSVISERGCDEAFFFQLSAGSFFGQLLSGFVDAIQATVGCYRATGLNDLANKAFCSILIAPTFFVQERESFYIL